ncbi:MAG TPA: putative cytokinetic ring protein SteA [Acidimicrobiales bacterium]|nr:putative cytokinetic ring protein SteA [Acidimicrobiales bacterium]
MFAMFARKGVAVPDSAGVARVGRRTKELTRRLRPGDVAVIDHEDLDRVAAEGLVNRRVGGVVNAAASISGRYPNVGPLLLAAAGIPLVDKVGSEVMDLIADGQEIRLAGNEVWHDGVMVATGVRQDLDSLERDYEAAKLAVGAELERFAENTLVYLREEHQSVLGSLGLPDLNTKVKGRQVLVVVRGADYRDDLAHLRSYVREIRPVLIGVDGGADALLEFGLRPQLILGDFDSVSDQALRCGAELVVHAYPGGRAPGAARLEALNVPHLTVEASGTSEDVAMLLAYEQGAELIVAVGSHASMVDFLDKGRGGMASTFLTRLKIGQLLVDAKGVSKLYESRIRKRDLIFFLLAAMLCFVVVIVAVFPRVFLESFWLLIRESWRSLSH